MKPPQIHEALKADYECWIRMINWEREEAVALLSGVEPLALDPFYRIENNIPHSLPNEYMDWLDVLLRDGLYSHENCRTAKDVLKWAARYNVPIPPRLSEAASTIPALQSSPAAIDQGTPERLNASAEKTKFKSLRKEQEHRERCRGIAAMEWSKNDSRTIEDMAQSDEIVNFGCEGKVYDINTVRDWIKDLCPNRTPGRRPRK